MLGHMRPCWPQEMSISATDHIGPAHPYLPQVETSDALCVSNISLCVAARLRRNLHFVSFCVFFFTLLTTN